MVDQDNTSSNEQAPTEKMVIVGVAASAGGLEATSILAQNLPPKLGAAYVLAQHMSPSHKSMLVQLLARETTLNVREIEDHELPQPDTIYVPPPGFDVILEDGMLQLRPPEGHLVAPKPSADRLFKSIALELRERAVGVVLSGTGSDGSYGVQAIREADGITIAQEPSSCKYDSMPVSAMRTGCVDLCLTPRQIGEHLEDILKRRRDFGELKEINTPNGKNSDLFHILLAHTLVDFRHYKENTINRRIHRRMIAKGIEHYNDYVELCRRSVEEVEALYRDLLISVTHFFRDPDQFNTLRNTLAEKLKDNKDPIRIWIPGCATGEEAYSIAILAVEALGGLENVEKEQLQIFATDIDDRALAIARKGQYPSSAINDVPEEFQARYFDLADDHYTVRQRLKSFVLFSRHNVFQDAPFISIDLVSIRNVMIYFESKLQERVLTRIQYALNPDGLLFLGTSETTGLLENYFVPTQQYAKIFRKRSAKMGNALSPETTIASNLPMRPGGHRARAAAADRTDLWRFDSLARSVCKVGFLTNRDRTIVKIYGDIAPFVEMTNPINGGLTLDVLRKVLSYEANSMLLIALKQKESRAGQWHELDGRDFNTVRMTAWPIIDDDGSDPLVLIGFETEMRTAPDPSATERTDYLDYLEAELARTRDTLQVTIEQLQTSNEELQSLNEELQSSNEELQSTNEELETSNEELQSTNEELITVNEELLVNTSQLERISAELAGLIKGLPTVMMMLDQGLLIRQASKSAVRQFDIRERGTSLGHLSQCHLPANFPPLVDLCSQALLDRKNHTRQFEDNGVLCTLTVSPLTTDHNGLIGLIVLLEQVDMSVDAVLNQTLRRFGEIGSWRVNLLTGAVDWSDETYRIHGIDQQERALVMADGIDFYLEEDRPKVKAAIEHAIQSGESFHFYARLKRGDGQIIVVESAGSAMYNDQQEPVALVGVFRDFSKMRNEQLLMQHYNQLAADQEIGFFTYDIYNDLMFWKPRLYELLRTDKSVVPTLAMTIEQLVDHDRDALQAQFSAAIEAGRRFDIDSTVQMANGTQAPCRVSAHIAASSEGEPRYVYGAISLI
ncbi:hypothetical protein BFP70_00080 [Thioclava sp. SK-1]|uniref:chemotaxis protein CheB n=1 Tax=Thioclava sp. SK-1 TaxID=1889770 RepID=UPI0008267C15|nr:chemotaxis protein CheB [Thioclava sp. SK-1]OCX66609.1 hypothetical protein BFP70_00080 [Thioclava sp. SK-1]